MNVVRTKMSPVLIFEQGIPFFTSFVICNLRFVAIGLQYGCVLRDLN